MSLSSCKGGSGIAWKLGVAISVNPFPDVKMKNNNDIKMTVESNFQSWWWWHSQAVGSGDRCGKDFITQYLELAELMKQAMSFHGRISNVFTAYVLKPVFGRGPDI